MEFANRLIKLSQVVPVRRRSKHSSLKWLGGVLVLTLLWAAPGAAEFTTVRKLTAGADIGTDDGSFVAPFVNDVAVSGDTLAVGGPGADVGGNLNQGAVYVFLRNRGGADNWGRVVKRSASDGDQDDVFGTAVAIDGDTLVVGASGADVAGNFNQGAAYVFQRNHGGANNWGQVAKLTASDGMPQDSESPALSIA